MQYLSARRLRVFPPSARRVVVYLSKHALDPKRCWCTRNDLHIRLREPIHLLQRNLDDLVHQGLLVRLESGSVISYKVNVERMTFLNKLSLLDYSQEIERKQSFLPLLKIGAKVVVTTTSGVDVLTVKAGRVSTITCASEDSTYIVVANESTPLPGYPSTTSDDPVVRIPTAFAFDKMTGNVFSFIVSSEKCVVTDLHAWEKATVAEWDPTKTYESTYPNTHGY